MPRKRPPPSPIRHGGAMRPPPLPASAAPAVAGGGLGLKIGMGVGIGLVAVVVLAGGTWGLLRILGRDGREEVASAENQPATSTLPATEGAQEENSPDNQPKGSPPSTAEAASPEESPTAVPAELPETSPGVTPPLSTEPPAAKPPAPTVTPPASTPSTTTPPATPPPPTTPAATTPWDDVRQRGNFLLIPEPKVSTSVEIAKIDVAKPTDCDLTITGADDFLPMGQAIKLDKEDSADKRTWKLSFKGNGALNKDRVVAEFTLSGKSLSFQWRSAAPAASFPLDYCLLWIEVGGEKEVCRMAKPVPLPPPKITPGEAASIELKVPVGIAQKGQVLKLEITPIDFPSVQFQANQGLQAGQATSLKVTGSASGTVPPDLDIEVKFECTGGKAVLKLSATAVWPPDAKGKSVQGKISTKMLEARKTKVANGLTALQNRKGLAEKELARLEKIETAYNSAMPRTNVDQNQLAILKANLANEMAGVQTELTNCTVRHDTATATVSWCDDMLALCKDLESRARLGIRVYREVGQEVVEIVAADVAAGP